MAWRKRSDGTLVRKLSSLRRMVPFLMPTRNEAVVYSEQRVDVTHTLAFLEEHPDVTLFQVVLASVVRTFAERSELNRFVVGNRIYQRKKIEVSFAVKKAYSDAGKLTTVKVGFEPTDRLPEVARRVDEAVSVGKGERDTSSEKEMNVLTRLPRPLLGRLIRVQRVLDELNLVPAAMLRDDPMYASIFVANLGSIGLDAVYHHLYEYGTIPFFACIGRVKKAPVVDAEGELAVRDVLDVRFTFDERITDGWYCARSLDLFREWVEAPEQLV